jgi:hypothetical protein
VNWDSPYRAKASEKMDVVHSLKGSPGTLSEELTHVRLEGISATSGLMWAPFRVLAAAAGDTRRAAGRRTGLEGDAAPGVVPTGPVLNESFVSIRLSYCLLT